MTKPNHLEQNCVDWFNNNKFDNTLSILLKKDKTLHLEDDKLTATINKVKTVIAEKKDFNFFIVEDNSLGLVVDTRYSPFQILMRYNFNNNFKAAYQFVGMTYMDMDFPYVRVGVKYFKTVEKTDRYKIDREELIVWNKEEIKQDYGKELLQRVEVYDDFIIEPNNSNYKKTVKGFYNLYQPFPHKAKPFDEKKGLECISWSVNLLKHIFGEHYELGLIYLKVLYENPKQALPILVLTSEERSTGKSTLVDWFSIIFGGNMVVINPQDIDSSFNSSYATKNVIAIEESRFDSIQTTEKLKALATQKTLLVNTKFVAPYNTPFYGKLIITSNDESKFSRVDTAEIRYWVRQVPTLEGKANHNILEDLISEIPYLLYYLSTLPEVDFTKSRQVFTPEQIATTALKTVKEESKPSLQKEIEILLDDFCANNSDIEELQFISSDIKDMWFRNDNNASRNYITKILDSSMKLKRADKSSRYTPNLNDSHITKVGSFFTYNNPFFKENKNPELKIDLDDEPF